MERMTIGDRHNATMTERARRKQQLSQLSDLVRARMHATQSPIEWSEMELTIPQYRALHLLVTGPHRMSEVATSLGTSMQATTSLIDRLVEKELVAREHDTADRRVVLCHLTPLGQDEVERVYRIGQARLDLLIDVLADDELDRVIDAFAVLAEAALRLQSTDGASSDATESSGRPIAVVATA
jgi:DNA-binding MarR family transcriptional regulator